MDIKYRTTTFNSFHCITPRLPLLTSLSRFPPYTYQLRNDYFKNKMGPSSMKTVFLIHFRIYQLHMYVSLVFTALQYSVVIMECLDTLLHKAHTYI